VLLEQLKIPENNNAKKGVVAKHNICSNPYFYGFLRIGTEDI
jgi:hypothetical protein